MRITKIGFGIVFGVLALMTQVPSDRPTNILAEWFRDGDLPRVADYLSSPPTEYFIRHYALWGLGSIAVLCLFGDVIWWILKWAIAKLKLGNSVMFAQPAPDISISTALDYIVNDSVTDLKQPPAPYIMESGPHQGKKAIPWGIEHEDARVKAYEKLISGDLTAWGHRQIECPMPNQFEAVLRIIPREYWDSHQLDFYTSLYYTETKPQTSKLPNKSDAGLWTALMLSKQQVQLLWPPQSQWQQLWKKIKRKPRIKARADLSFNDGR
jgi:hypothetical protein